MFETPRLKKKSQAYTLLDISCKILELHENECESLFSEVRVSPADSILLLDFGNEE